MKKLDDYQPTLWENIWWPIERFLEKVFRDIPHKIKWFIQRGKRGWADCDIWCYSEDTEILTNQGWKYFKNLNKTEKVLTINPLNDTIEYQKPVKYYKYKYKGRMILFKNKTFDLLVTPNHNMYLGNNKFIEAKKIKPFTQKRIKCIGYNWKGKKQEYFILPPVKNERIKFSSYSIKKLIQNGFNNKYIAKKLGCSISTIKSVKYNKRILTDNFPSIQIKMNDFLKFLGIYLAEGWTNGNVVSIAQKKKKIRKDIRNLLYKLPFSTEKEQIGKFSICDKRLGNYLKQFGKSKNKFIPQEIKDLSKRQLKILLNWYLKGDGYINKQGIIRSKTVSKQLADDLQEIYFKLGFEASINFYKDRFNGYFEITRRISKNRWLKTMNIQEKDYNSNVYCISVPNKVLYVRRKGKPTVSGNSLDDYLSGWLPKAIRRLRDTTYGYPADKGMTFKKWKKILTKMAKGFDSGRRLLCSLSLNKKKLEKQKKELDESLKLFSKYFLNLWD